MMKPKGQGMGGGGKGRGQESSGRGRGWGGAKARARGGNAFAPSVARKALTSVVIPVLRLSALNAVPT